MRLLLWRRRGSEKGKEISSERGPVCLLLVFFVRFRHCWADLEVRFLGQCWRLLQLPLFGLLLLLLIR